MISFVGLILLNLWSVFLYMTKDRKRNWFLTIWTGAECFDSFKDTLLDIKCVWSYILHQPEFDEVDKGVHYHLCLMFDNARTFQQVQKLFMGAHIEYMKYEVKSHRYLLHLDNDDKIKYDIRQIVSNRIDLEDLLESTDEVFFSLDDFEMRVKETKEIDSLFDCCKIYGLKQTNQYRHLIKDLLEEWHICITSNHYVEDYKRIKAKNENLEQNLRTFYDMYADIVEKYKILNDEYNKKGMF